MRSQQRLGCSLGALIVVLVLSRPGVVTATDNGRELPPSSPTPVGDGMVVAGQRVGPLRLGMSLNQILQAMPPGYTRELFDQAAIVLYEWRAQGIWVSLDARTQAVRLISAFGLVSYKTDTGISLLQPEAKIPAAYGGGFRRYNYPDDHIVLVRYVALGLQFGIVDNSANPLLHGRIFTIGVFAPGHEPPLVKPPTP